MMNRAPSLATRVALSAIGALLAACGGTNTDVSPLTDGDALLADAAGDASSDASAIGYAPVWALSAGDGTSQLGDVVTVDEGGDILIGGEFGGAMAFGSIVLRATDTAVANGFVVKLDAAGHARWGKRFGGEKGGEQRVRVIASSSAMGVVVGGFFSDDLDCGNGTVLASAGGSDAFLALLADDGTTRACLRFGDADHQAVTGIALAEPSSSSPAGSLGRVVVVGEFAGTIDLGGGALTSAGGEDFFVVTFDLLADASLAHVWSKRFGGTDEDMLPRLARAPSGAIALAGIYRETIDFGGGPLPAHYDGGFVAMLDQDGGHLWSRGFVGDNSESPIALAFDSAGDLVVGGRFAGSADFGSGIRTSVSGEDAFLASWTGSGVPRWSARFGGDGEDSINGLAIDAFGHIHVCGELTTSLDGLVAHGGPDAFVAELDDRGNMLFRAGYGDDGEQHAYRLALVEGAPIVVGSFFGELDFGLAGRLESNGGFDQTAGDLFLVRF